MKKIEAWNKCTEAKKIVSKACANAKKTSFGKGKTKEQLLGTISDYAKKDALEALADSFENVYIHGKDASPVALEIKRLALEQISLYEGEKK